MNDQQLLKLMTDGAFKICDHAKTQHLSGAYSKDEAQNMSNYKEWDGVALEVRRFADRVKAALKEGKV